MFLQITIVRVTFKIIFQINILGTLELFAVTISIVYILYYL